MELNIPAHEHGLIRVFAVNRAPAEMKQALGSQDKLTLAADLLGRPIAPGGAELFPVGDLAGIGLSGYLNEGYAVPEAQLKEARPKLDALEGYVLLLFSAAFDGQAAQLSLGADLTLIGTFEEAQPDMSVRPLESEAALPAGVSTETPPAHSPRNKPSGSLLILGLMILAALILWWLFS